MKYVVTGGAGFIGSHIVKNLVNHGHLVTVVDNLHTGKIENLASVKNQIKFEKEDILNFDKLEPILNNSDGVFHQAGLTLVQESFEKEKQYFDVNVNGTKNILEIAKNITYGLFMQAVLVFTETQIKFPQKKIPREKHSIHML